MEGFMSAVAYQKPELLKMINLLPVNQQIEIANEILEREQLKLIEELEESFRPHNFSMEDIVAITKEVRKQHDETKK